MVLYVYSNLDEDSWVVINDIGTLCCEFSRSEIELLNAFAPVKGFYQNEILCSVYVRDGDMVWRLSEDVKYSGSCRDIWAKGYLVLDSSNITIGGVLPKIMYGASALVTDQGSLVYFNIDKDIRVRLSAFCRTVSTNALRSSLPMYIFDDKLDFVSMKAFMGEDYFRIDKSEVHRKDLGRGIEFMEIYWGDVVLYE